MKNDGLSIVDPWKMMVYLWFIHENDGLSMFIHEKWWFIYVYPWKWWFIYGLSMKNDGIDIDKPSFFMDKP